MQAIVNTLQIVVIAATAILGFLLLVTVFRLMSIRKREVSLVMELEEGTDL